MTWSLAVGSVHWVQDLSSVDLAKLLITTGVWIAYAAAMVLRLWNKLVSQRLAWACVALFAVALLSLPVVNASRHPVAPARPASAAKI